MNAFQIQTGARVAIPIKDLDKEAAEFWGKKIDPKWFANPTPQFINTDNLEGIGLTKAKMKHTFTEHSNWYDNIGYVIANQTNYCKRWTNIVNSMMAEALDQCFIDTTEGYNDRPVKVTYFEHTDKDKPNWIEIPESVQQSLFATLEYFKPYIELINHWQSKGYIPVQIKE